MCFNPGHTEIDASPCQAAQLAPTHRCQLTIKTVSHVCPYVVKTVITYPRLAHRQSVHRNKMRVMSTARPMSCSCQFRLKLVLQHLSWLIA